MSRRKLEFADARSQAVPDAVSEFDFVLEFANEEIAQLELAKLGQISGLAVVTPLAGDATRVGIKARFELLLETCEKQAWKRRLHQSEEWATFTNEARQEFANIHDAHLFFSPAERVYLISLSLGNINTKRMVALNDLKLHGVLYERWIASGPILFLRQQPLQLIRDYYGDEIALYFAFLGHYTAYLVPLAVAGLATFIYSQTSNNDDGDALYTWPSLAFALCTFVWDTLFFESWKRQECRLAYEWNGPCSRTEEIKTPLLYKRKVPWPIGYALSLVLLSVSVAFKTWLLFQLLWLDVVDLRRYAQMLLLPTGLEIADALPLEQHLPSILLALTMMFTSQINRVLVVFSTRALEQRETLEEAKDAIVLKLVVQHFINSHFVLLYIGLVQRDIPKLKYTLASLVVIHQMYEQVLEVGVPFVRSGLLARWFKQEKKPQVEAELELQDYPGVFSDYLELWVQMGQISLYSSIFPLAPLVALVNNVMEIKTDAFRLMHACKRPIPFSKPSGIGSWLQVFELIGFVSLASNAALAFVVVQGTTCAETCWSDFHLLLVLVSVEHAAVLCKFCLKFFIPDLPPEIASKMEANQRKESLMEKQRLVHRVQIKRLLASDGSSGGSRQEEDLSRLGKNRIEQEALVEYAVMQSKAKLQAEEQVKRLENELHMTRQTLGFSNSLGITVLWINLAVALFAMLLVFSGW